MKKKAKKAKKTKIVRKKSAPKKRVVKKAAKKPNKPSAKKSKKQNKVKAQPKKVSKPPVPGAQQIGKVTHYFPHVSAAVIKVAKGTIRQGDTLYFKGHTSDFKMAVTSMQVDHRPIAEASKGAEIGIQVPQRVREGDAVYRVA